MAERWKRVWIAAGFCCLLALLLSVTVRVILRRSAWITLADEAGAAGGYGSVSAGRTPTVLEVAPRTVQAAIATLRRPETYCRAVSVTRYWRGGSGSRVSTVSVSGGWTRVDLELADGHTRHSLTDGAATYLWYDQEPECLLFPAGSVTADDEQHIPTYEDVLALPATAITAADYREFGGTPCLYAETAAGDGYLRRWWISVETGLLTAAEILSGDETVYWMETLGERLPAEDAFTLPDGTELLA